MFDHFGEGGSLDGHIGQRHRHQRRRQHDRRRRAAREQQRARDQRQPERRLRVQRRRRLCLRPQRRELGAAGVRQGVERRIRRSLRQRRGHQRRRQHMAVAAYWESGAATGVNGNQADDSIPQAGAVYVFTRSGNAWTQQAYIKASNTGNAGVGDVPGDGDQFGFSLALSDDGNTLAVGATSEDSNANGINGNQADNSASSRRRRVRLRRERGNTWTQQAYIKSDASPMAHRRRSVRIFRRAERQRQHAGGRRLRRRRIGAHGQRPDRRDAERIRRRLRVRPRRRHVEPAGVHQDLERRRGRLLGRVRRAERRRQHAGDGVDRRGLPLHRSRACCRRRTASATRRPIPSSGAAAVFTRNGTTWTQQAYVKASNTGPNDWFGVRLVLSGDGNTLALGAQNEDSAAQGINGGRTMKRRDDAGAVYLFTRTGTMWAQQAYVKGLEQRRRSTSSAAPWRSAATAGRWSSARAAKTAAREAPTATRRTTRWTKPAPRTCSHASARRGVFDTSLLEAVNATRDRSSGAVSVVIWPTAAAFTSAHLAGQTAPVKQTGYLKASNPACYDHFGEGGALPATHGQRGRRSAATAARSRSARRTKAATRAASTAIENDDSAYNAGAVYVFTSAPAASGHGRRTSRHRIPVPEIYFGQSSR